jgi:hypothetical protein
MKSLCASFSSGTLSQSPVSLALLSDVLDGKIDRELTVNTESWGESESDDKAASRYGGTNFALYVRLSRYLTDKTY